MNFGETIKKLRKNKDMTQEQLAEYLNISTQAVSRWETNASLPDITLIPALANIFDVTSDVLLGIDITAKEKRIQEILDEVWEYSKKGQHKKVMEILRAGHKEFPNDYRIMDQFLSKPLETSEIIKFGEKILAECTKDSFRHNAIRALCGAYAKIGEIEKAKELLLRTPFITECYEFIIDDIGSEQEKSYKMRDNIFMLMNFMVLKMACLDNYDSSYTTQEKITIRKKIITIVDCLVENDEYGHFRERAAWAYLDIGKFYTELGDYDIAIENLKQAADYVIKIDCACGFTGDNYNPDKIYTSLLLRGKKYKNVNNIIGVDENYSMMLLHSLNEKSFEPIRHKTDFIEIEERLKKYAKKR